MNAPRLDYPSPSLRVLLIAHAGLTLAAGAVLIAAPELIPSAVGIRLEPNAYLVCYLLAAAELSVSVLSWGARNLTNRQALRIIITAFIVMHAASGVLEIYAFVDGLGAAIWGNVAARAVVVFLFAYFGLYKMPQKTDPV